MRRASKFEFAQGLSLPVDAATQTFGFLGRKRGGKTYGATKMVEGLVAADVQVVVLDTVGKLFGLRLAANGKSRGLDMPIIGGLRGDIPLDPGAGALIADAVVDTGKSFIIDVAQFSKGARQRFLHAFGEQLWQRKKAQQEPQPIHLLIEEAQLVIPQQVWKGQEEMVGIWEEIVRLGGNYGIGVSLLSQRPQSVNKEVLTQVECLVVFQTNGVQEKKVIKEWIVSKGTEGTDLIEELPSLPRGTAFIWSPQWLEHFGKHMILPKWTFDSTSTPKVGVRTKRVELKPLDVAKLKAQMAEVVAKGVAATGNVKELKARVVELEKQLKTERADPLRDEHRRGKLLQPLVESRAATGAAIDKVSLRLLEKHTMKLEKYNGDFNGLLVKLNSQRDRIAQSQQVVVGALDNLRTAMSSANKSATTPAERVTPLPPGRYTVKPTETKVTGSRLKFSMGTTYAVVDGPHAGAEVTDTATGFKLIGKMTDMVTALRAKPGLSRDELATVVGMTPGSGGFNNYLSALKSEGLVVRDEHDSNGLAITARCHAFAAHYYDLRLSTVMDRHGSKLVGKMRAMVNLITSSGHEGFTRDALADAVGMARGSGGFNNYVSSLKSLGFVVAEKGLLVVAPVFR